MASREHEHTLNVWLAELLRRRGLNARQERGRKGGRIDVEIRVGRVRIALEAKQGQTNAKKKEAIDDANRRLKQGLADCAIAICYPEGITEKEQIPDSRILWTIRTPIAQETLFPSEVTPQWSESVLDELASIIRLAPMQLGNPDHVADSLSASLDSAVDRLDDNQKQMLARHVNLPASKAGRSRWNKASKRALLIVATAVMFHARLDSHLGSLRPEFDSRATKPETPFTGTWPPNRAQECTDSEDPISAFSDAWGLILALDYKPIFETGRAALYACPTDHAFTEAIRDSARAALRVVGNIAGLRHDLLGRVFHTVLDTARFDGSFYTTTPAATLLSSLAVTEDMCDWSDPNAVSRLRVVDPACGTGTLLMATAERIRDLSPRLRNEERFARTLIDQVLSGYDVNVTATHMAATTLGLLSPSTRFRNMKIGLAYLGVDGEGDAYVGSLEFLEQRPKLVSWTNAAQPISQIDSGEAIPVVEPTDLVIMNPPYTRDSLRYDQFKGEVEKKLKAREKRLFANKPIHLSAIGSAFLLLADYINKTDSGTLASVMPLVMATNKSGMEIRRHLAARYHVETIVTSHDPKRIYFSENTDIGEMLLVCRRWSGSQEDKPPTRIVNLAKNPSSPADAVSVATAIRNGTLGDRGTIQEWPSERISVGNWGAVQFLSPYLCERFVEIVHGGVFLSKALGDIAEIGPAGQRIREAYERTAMPDSEGRMALWQHETDVTQSMLARPDTHIIAKPKYRNRAEKYWGQRSRLLLPTHLRLTTIRAMAVRLSVSSLGSLWVPCRLTAQEGQLVMREKALCAFLNSSIGILSMLGNTISV